MKIQRAALAVTALLLLAGCGAETASTSAADTARSSRESAPQPLPGLESAPGAAAAENPAPAYSTEDKSSSDADSAATGSRAAAEVRAVISQGQVSVQTTDVDRARFTLQKLLDGWDGTIANEKSDADERGRTVRESLELRLPSSRFDTAMDDLSGLGTLVDRSRTSEDVSTEVIDNRSRVRSQRLSLARVQALLARAKTIEEVIAIESQLSQRQADLDSLVQQQAYLADQTSLATIHLYLSVPDHLAAEEHADDSGVLSGIQSGWHRLGASTSAALTGIGAVLPFAVLVSLVGLPVWFWRRRTTRA
ncbi:MAG: hypothetical protein JWQ74_2108 [Marmoricola sp.]|nr:hypothetical protein [Marmoricola sp.]